MSIIELSATEILDRLKTTELSAREVTDAFISQIESVEPQIDAFLSTEFEKASAKASEIDQRRANGDELGPLAGIPVGVKDVLCTNGSATTCASKMLENFVPPYDATVIRKINDADAITVGKNNMDEFAMGSSTENSAFKQTKNPWDTTRIPGGSSGGSAAAVAARMCPLSLGTDTGGSVRQPAALCGVVGLKPTYGRVSRFGLVAFASSLDQIGPFATTVEDAALMLNVIAGADENDSTCSDHPVPDYTVELNNSLSGMKIGIPAEHFDEGVDDQVREAIEAAKKVFEDCGATCVPINLPMTQHGIATYYVIAPCEASSNLARYDGAHYGHRSQESSDLASMYANSRTEGFGDEVKRRIMLGTYALSAGYYDAYYLKASKVRRLIFDDFQKNFEQVDLILGPTTPTTAYKLGEKTDDPLEMYLADIFTVTTNLAGIPAVSIPCGLDDAGLPIGLHLQAPPFGESRLLNAAHQFQLATNWHKETPPVVKGASA